LHKKIIFDIIYKFMMIIYVGSLIIFGVHNGCLYLVTGVFFVKLLMVNLH